MKKILFIFLFLPMVCAAQALQTLDYRFDFAGETDSIALPETIPAGCLVTRCVSYIDTTIVNMSAYSVTLRESQVDLLTRTIDETDVIGVTRINRPDAGTGTSEETPVFHFTQTDAVSGRLRLYIEYIELY